MLNYIYLKNGYTQLCVQRADLWRFPEMRNQPPYYVCEIDSTSHQCKPYDAKRFETAEEAQKYLDTIAQTLNLPSCAPQGKKLTRKRSHTYSRTA